MYRQLLSRLFTDYPVGHRNDFLDEIDFHNYSKAVLFSEILMVFSFFVYAIAFFVNDTCQITTANFVFFIISCVNFLLVKGASYRSDTIGNGHKLLIYMLILTVLGWNSSLIMVAPDRYEMITAYSVGVLAVSSVFYLRWYMEAMLYTSSLILLLMFTAPSMASPAMPKIVLLSSVVITAWIISRMLYYKEIENFMFRFDLKTQNRNIQAEILKQSLKLKNSEEEKIEEIIIAITKLLGIHNPYTNGHSENVAFISQRIAVEMGLSNEDVKDAYWSGMVHDLGKLLVPIEILNKNGPLTDAEYETIKLHPQWGYEVLCHSVPLSNIAVYVLHHHERWDGDGYTDRLSGNEIPLISQILSVADSWDAMTSERPYRKAISEQTAINQLKENRGSQFSPDVVDAFLEMHAKTEITNNF